MAKFRAGMISKLMSKGSNPEENKEESEESEQANSSDDEMVENTIFKQESDADDDDQDDVGNEDGSEVDDEELGDVNSEIDDEEEDDDEEDEDDDVEEEEEIKVEPVKTEKRKASEDKKSPKKAKKTEDDDEKEEEDGDEEKNIREREPETPEKLARTLFIGNLPHDFNKKAFKTMLIEYGPLQNFRVRSIAPSKESLSKKVAYLSGKVNANKPTVNVYAVYKTPESIKKALEINGKEFEKHILRADRVTPVKSYQNTKSTVFVGNVPTKATDNQLHEFFSACGTINKVRIIRDSQTCAGKGIAYIEFTSKDAALAAIEMNGQKFQNRDIRVQEYHYKQQNQRKSFQGTQGQKRFSGKPRVNKPVAGKGFTGEQAHKKKFQNKSKVIKAKNALAKKKNLAKILTKQ